MDVASQALTNAVCVGFSPARICSLNRNALVTLTLARSILDC
jgi:hypothetical protein